MSKYLEYFDGAFDDSVAEKIKLENKPYVAYSSVEGKVVYTVVPQIDGIYYDVAELVKKSIPTPSTGYGEVDLGLPSGIKWADRNVGAETPQDYGAYFSWGNVEGVVYGTTKKSEDDVIRIVLINGGVSADTITQEMIDNIKLEGGENLKLEIEGFLKTYTFINGTTFDENTYSTTLGGQYTGSTLDAEHDAATVNMGSDWRMPTSVETDELVQNTDHYYIGEDGNIVAESELDAFKKLHSICFVKKGEDFDYNDRSNFIEFPFAGYCYNSVLLSNGLTSEVWSSSVNEYDAENVLCLNFDSAGSLYGSAVSGRYSGQSVRGVHA